MLRAGANELIQLLLGAELGRSAHIGNRCRVCAFLGGEGVLSLALAQG